jgi:hypothetical protein
MTIGSWSYYLGYESQKNIALDSMESMRLWYSNINFLNKKFSFFHNEVPHSKIH